MTPDIKELDPLIKHFSPPEDVKKTFYKTLFGSLMGQTVLFLGLLAIYFAIVVLLYSYAKAPLQALQTDLGAIWFWTLFATPFVCILAFTALPTALRALRERRLKATAIGGIPKPGYFRLHHTVRWIATYSSVSMELIAKSLIGSFLLSRRCCICRALPESANLLSWLPAFCRTCAARRTGA
jgi:hypothetical protein